MLKLIDVGFGNISALEAWLSNSGLTYEIITNKQELNIKDVVIMPGVGSADYALERLMASGLHKKILEHIFSGGRYVGICVGMQILFETLEEGPCVGFGVFAGKITKLGPTSNTKWSDLTLRKFDTHPSWHPGFGRRSKFQARVFNNHVYGAKDVKLKNSDFLIMDNGNKFIQIIGNKNVMGFQFHPEKSQKFGDMIGNFLGRIV
jgi:imidazole glycerol-phosphate synthase subunit HisH